MLQLRKTSITLFLLLIILTTSFSQEKEIDLNSNSVEVSNFELANRVKLATTVSDYPVTPGDIYLVNIQNSIISKTMTLRIESNCTVEMPLFGVIDTKQLSFFDFRKVVIDRINSFYENPEIQISIQAVGTFQVQITGEVKTSKLLNVWGLSRLSSLVEQNKTAYASIRNIEVIDLNGKKSIYDLFKARRLGALDQDPYIRPGDKIVLSKYDRQVSISGEVRRPGSYQLLSGETLADLIKFYGDGLTPYADNNVEITKWDKERLLPGYMQYIDLKESDMNKIELSNLDKIKINSKENQQMVYFEGAVGGNSSSIIKYHISNGELLSSAIRFIEDSFPVEADLRNVYIERNEDSKRIYIDLDDLLYNHNKNIDVVLVANDRIIIPFRQYFVNISGEVNDPGRYPYIPNRTWDYYINMAGGFNNLTHSGNKLKILDYNNIEKSMNVKILPEDTLIVPSNDVIYNVNRYTAFIGVITSMITSIITINLLISN